MEEGEPGRGGGQEAGLGQPSAPRFPGGASEEGGVTWVVSSLGWGHQLCYY